MFPAGRALAPFRQPFSSFNGSMLALLAADAGRFLWIAICSTSCHKIFARL
jgi:hypothetical protein